MNGPQYIHLSKRLKSTLASLHSYCLKRSEQAPLIKQMRSKSNKSLTKYCSIRQFKKQSKKQPLINKTTKKQEQVQNLQNIFQIKSRDLIEIIKLKLKNNKLSQKIKTQGKQTKNITKKGGYFKRYNPNAYQQIDKYSNTRKPSFIKNDRKSKKIQFFINNSKIKLIANPKTKRERAYEQFSVTLQNRPISAIQTYERKKNSLSQLSLRNRLSKVSPQKMNSKLSVRQRPQVVHPQRASNKTERYNNKDREISAWEIQQDQMAKVYHFH